VVIINKILKHSQQKIKNRFPYGHGEISHRAKKSKPESKLESKLSLAEANAVLNRISELPGSISGMRCPRSK
jgi:hypothetical protein